MAPIFRVTSTPVAVISSGAIKTSMVALVIGGSVNDSNIVFVETVNKRLGVTPATTVDLLHEEAKNGNCARNA
jgi:hypothetical protein